MKILGKNTYFVVRADGLALRAQSPLCNAKDGTCPTCSRKSALRAGFASDVMRLRPPTAKLQVPLVFGKRKGTRVGVPFLLPKTGLEPVRPQWPGDFKSPVSTIPPLWQQWKFTFKMRFSQLLRIWLQASFMTSEILGCGNTALAIAWAVIPCSIKAAAPQISSLEYGPRRCTPKSTPL